jgi:hypothetical protein
MGGECSVEVFCLFTFITALSLSPFFIFRWLIDYCLTSSDQYYLSYIQDDNNVNIILKLCRNERRDGSTASTTSVCQWKRMERWVETKSLVVCSGYKAPTLFRNLERGLYRGTLQTHYPLKYTVRLSALLPDNSISRGIHLSAIRVSARWASALENFTSTQFYFIFFFCGHVFVFLIWCITILIFDVFLTTRAKVINVYFSSLILM